MDHPASKKRCARAPGMRRNSRSWALLPVFAAFFVACTAPRPEVKDLEARARQYMEVRQGRDWGVMYDEFLDPAGRAAIARPAFLAKRGGGFDILGFEVLRSEVQPETQPPRGKVQVQLDALIPVLLPGGGSQTVRRSVEEPQQWVFRDGSWYIQLQK